MVVIQNTAVDPKIKLQADRAIKSMDAFKWSMDMAQAIIADPEEFPVGERDALIIELFDNLNQYLVKHPWISSPADGEGLDPNDTGFGEVNQFAKDLKARLEKSGDKTKRMRDRFKKWASAPNHSAHAGISELSPEVITALYSLEDVARGNSSPSPASVAGVSKDKAQEDLLREM